jgi:Zn-dependent peptidase ImmA (M78 family)/transcriptional regulator with XRE-family HTH domain
MKSFNGNRLKTARQYRGLTVEELAQKINVSKQAVSQYETGRIEDVPFQRIFSISNVLNFPYQYFVQDDIPSLKTGATYFRSLMKTSKKYRLAQEIKMEHIAVIYSYLSEYVDFPNLNIPSLEEKAYAPTKAAKVLRDFWGLEDKPIENIMQTVEQNGIIVTTFSTETDDIDAFSQYVRLVDSDLFIIALSNNKESAARINFDIAHELGHIMLHEWSENEEVLTREEFKQKEKEANEFAAAFLLPKETFTQDVILDPQRLDYYVQLKRKWKVSIAAMLYRSCDLGLISQGQYQYMIRVMQNKGWRKTEPLDKTMKATQPSLLADAVGLLLDNNVFTTKEFVDELENMGMAMNPDELEVLLNLQKGTLMQKNESPTQIVSLKPLGDYK